MGLSLITPPAAEPLTLVEAKLHLKVDLSDDDVLVTALIVAARTAVENYLSRSLIEQTWRQTFCNWRIQLERPPHIAITEVSYIDVDGDTQTLASTEYQADLSGDQPARVVPAYGAAWPDFRTETLNPIAVEFEAGYGDAAEDVPAPIRSAMLLMIGHLYTNREAVNIGNIVNVIPLAVQWLLDPYRTLYQ